MTASSQGRDSPASPPDKTKWLLLYVMAGAIALIVAFAVGGDPLAERVVQFFLPAGAVLFVLVQGKQDTKEIVGKADENSEKLDELRHDLNGRMDTKISAALVPVYQRFDDLTALIEDRLPAKEA